MRLLIYFVLACLWACGTNAQQNVGIGTTTPNQKSILHLNSTTQGFLPPVMNNEQMNAISSPPPGLMIYNNQTQTPMVYAQKGWLYFPLTQNYIATYSWLPVSTGPKIIAWGSVDSSASPGFPDTQDGIVNINSGSDNFTVSWDAANRWYKLTLNNIPYTKDSMVLIITAVGNGSHDEIISTGELIENSTRRASIKFTDVSRMIANYSALTSRRRSDFHFILYSLKKDPF